MGLIVNTTDFVGRYELPENEFTDPKYDNLIDQYEKKYLKQLLGVTLFGLFKEAYEASVASPPVPMPDRFQVIFDAISEDDLECKEIRDNDGMKTALVGLLYFHLARELGIHQTVSGPRKTSGDVSNNISHTDADTYGRYNEGVDGMEVIQWYICQHKADYPEYNGQPFDIASPY